jgi:hypothetical protein
MSNGSATTVAPKLDGQGQRFSEVAHLDVERHAGALSLAHVAGRSRFGTTQSRRYGHDRPVTDLPVAQRR